MIKHLACQMDGNRRWAQQRGLHSFLGHKEGLEAVKRAITFCINRNIPYLSLYTFSLENFKRSEEEKSYLFDLIAVQSNTALEEFIKQGIRVRFVGDRSAFPLRVATICQKIEQETAHLSVLTLNFLFCYGSRQEIVHAAREIAKKVAAGGLSPDAIDNEQFEQHLWTHGTPDPDIIIRTGAVMRLSNFLLYQSAYSEYYFLDCMWPDMSEEHFTKVLENFATRQRRFGG